MKTIIVAMDYSIEAKNAMNYAAAAAAEQNFDLVLFNLYHVSIHALNARVPAASFYEMYRDEKDKLARTASQLASAYGIEVSTYIATGEMIAELQKCYEIHHGELIVMGMREKSLEQDLMGNTTTAAIHHLKFPVIAIPATVKYHGIKKVLFACDLARGVHSKVLEQVKELASNLNSEVEVFHVNSVINTLTTNDKVSKHAQEVDNALNGIQYYYKNVESDEIIGSINREIKEYGADLLIMVPYRYGFWGSLVHRSKTRIMASGNNIPLLSIPL
ncbi:universal stress protein [Sphingobacterium daejeonense]|uniref:universal stress protein n=1 Tax=Sphingobacterium daejeonense TaxID=371142 RepID=UPI0010C2D7CE|nr:universal stress protein [Sphingobacterium daejeonense]VTP91708.1 Universal stress protein family [Sphingobacterium daejeonense]